MTFIIDAIIYDDIYYSAIPSETAAVLDVIDDINKHLCFNLNVVNSDYTGTATQKVILANEIKPKGQQP